MAASHYSMTPSSSSYTSSTPASSLSGTLTHRLVERASSSRLASEYVRTSEELVGYVTYLEGALEKVRAEGQRFQQESLDARNQATLAAHRLTLAHRQAHILAADTTQALQTASQYKEQLALTQTLLTEEQHKSKNLESQIVELEKAIKKRDELVEACKLKERRSRRVLKKQNERLMRKATLSWILACLSNPYLEVDTSKERAASLIRMAQDLLKSEGQSQTETSGSLTFSDMKARSLRLECAYVENEIKHLLQPSISSSQTSEDHESAGIHTKTPELLTARSHFSSEVDKEGRSSSRGDLPNGCSPIRSILKAAQDFFDDVNGLDCMMARDQLESRELHNEESRYGRDDHKFNGHGCIAAQLESCKLHKVECRTGPSHHNVTVKERYARARFKVPPLDLSSSTKSAAFENPSSIHMQFGFGQVGHHFQDCGDEFEMREQDDEYLPRKEERIEKKQRVQVDVIRRGNLLNTKRDVEREGITQCQTDIMKTLQGLKKNMGYLLDLEERSHLKHFT
ncbi:hypothetical protein GOP47_0012140 [Adiantum capillus-veneris]|uniref:Uncharacterized protein n=1 Tax=Adiantum capillus-veneris TaxID=13818 RepID=A0A9D4UQ54_ADICA|nr:hypothetical protein GOP47_0012140 [Adiantum capillus-veneris]